MKIMPMNQNIQQKPAFGILYHKKMQPTVEGYNIEEMKDYKKSAQQLHKTSDSVAFNVFIQPIEQGSVFEGKGDILVAYQPKNKSAKYPEHFYSFADFKANFPEIMEDTETRMSRAAKRLASEYLNTSYKKLGPAERGAKND